MSRLYSPESLKRIVQDPSLIPKALALLKRDASKRLMQVNRYWYQKRHSNTSYEFIDQDWDNLIILDAARPEFLRDAAPDNFEVEERISPASWSLQFIHEQFVGRDLTDTIYVTANPYASEIPDGVFYKINNLHVSGWDNELKTVPPEEVVRTALEEFENHPNKRLILHFMQPHFPFLGPSGEHIDGGIGGKIHDDSTSHPWYQAMGSVRGDYGTLLQAYRENHEIAIQHVEELLRELPGRSVITADHANLIGERGFPFPVRMFGHPRDFPHPNLITVPYIEVDGKLREVTSEEPLDQNHLSDEVVGERLNALGYADT